MLSRQSSTSAGSHTKGNSPGLMGGTFMNTQTSITPSSIVGNSLQGQLQRNKISYQSNERKGQNQTASNNQKNQQQYFSLQ